MTTTRESAGCALKLDDGPKTMERVFFLLPLNSHDNEKRAYCGFKKALLLGTTDYRPFAWVTNF